MPRDPSPPHLSGPLKDKKDNRKFPLRVKAFGHLSVPIPITHRPERESWVVLETCRGVWTLLEKSLGQSLLPRWDPKGHGTRLVGLLGASGYSTFHCGDSSESANSLRSMTLGEGSSPECTGPRPPWWSSGWDSMLPLQGIRVQSFVRELDPTCCNEEFTCHN